ncbi:hypothetical protein NH340_JMT03381 [Sarcoptes scabiei]|nr:hypothetical protein NH340_JMT03381 [Sarcoptes scabiei]
MSTKELNSLRGVKRKFDSALAPESPSKIRTIDYDFVETSISDSVSPTPLSSAGTKYVNISQGQSQKSDSKSKSETIEIVASNDDESLMPSCNDFIVSDSLLPSTTSPIANSQALIDSSTIISNHNQTDRAFSLRASSSDSKNQSNQIISLSSTTSSSPSTTVTSSCYSMIPNSITSLNSNSNNQTSGYYCAYGLVPHITESSSHSKSISTPTYSQQFSFNQSFVTLTSRSNTIGSTAATASLISSNLLRQKQNIFNLSMCKLNRFRQSSDLSLHRSVMICNTLRMLEKELERDGCKVNVSPTGVSFISPVSQPPDLDFLPLSPNGNQSMNNDGFITLPSSSNDFFIPNSSNQQQQSGLYTAYQNPCHSNVETNGSDYERYLSIGSSSSSGRVTPFVKSYSSLLSLDASPISKNEIEMETDQQKVSLSSPKQTDIQNRNDCKDQDFGNVKSNVDQKENGYPSTAISNTSFETTLGKSIETLQESDSSIDCENLKSIDEPESLTTEIPHLMSLPKIEDDLERSSANKTNLINHSSPSTLKSSTTISSFPTFESKNISSLVSTIKSTPSSFSTPSELSNSNLKQINNSSSVNPSNEINSHFPNGNANINNVQDIGIFGDVDLSLYDFDLISPLSPPSISKPIISAEELIRNINTSSNTTLASSFDSVGSSSFSSSSNSSLSLSTSLTINAQYVAAVNGFSGQYFTSSSSLSPITSSLCSASSSSPSSILSNMNSSMINANSNVLISNSQLMLPSTINATMGGVSSGNSTMVMVSSSTPSAGSSLQNCGSTSSNSSALLAGARFFKTNEDRDQPTIATTIKCHN